jgi:hypothetical protein
VPPTLTLTGPSWKFLTLRGSPPCGPRCAGAPSHRSPTGSRRSR